MTSRFRRLTATLMLLAGLVAGACAATPAQQPQKRILFVGNSLTYWNDLPAVVCRMAEATGRHWECAGVTGPDLALEDHLRSGIAERKIRRGGWDLVVLQQGPSSLAEGRRMLIRDTARFAELARTHGAETALYSVWPARNRASSFAASISSYRAAAEQNGAKLLPVAEAWHRVLRQETAPALYGPDGLHPSAAGTYLAALVMIGHMQGEVPAALATREISGKVLSGLRLSDEQLDLLRAAAEQSLPR